METITMTKFDKIIFVHIPRTRGNSIRETLKNVVKSDLKIPFVSKHAYLEEFEPTENSFSFAFVRNPYHHAISFYEYHKNAIRKKEYNLEFKEWVKKGFPNHWEKQNNYLPEKPLYQTGYIIRNNKLAIDFLGKQESMERDFKKLLRIIGIHKDLNLLHWTGNSNGYSNTYNKFKEKNKKKFDDYYDRETIDIINRELHDDFVNFRYKKWTQ